MESAKTPMRNVYVMATGVKLRCRKEERHMLKLGLFPVDMAHEQAKELGKQKLLTAMRSVRGAYVCLDYVEIENDSGCQIMSQILFDKRHVKLALTTEGAA